MLAHTRRSTPSVRSGRGDRRRRRESVKERRPEREGGREGERERGAIITPRR